MIKFRIVISDLYDDEARDIAKKINNDKKLLDGTSAWVTVEYYEDSKN